MRGAKYYNSEKKKFPLPNGKTLPFRKQTFAIRAVLTGKAYYAAPADFNSNQYSILFSLFFHAWNGIAPCSGAMRSMGMARSSMGTLNSS